MPEYLAPGVYVEEVSFRSKSIEGVSTTTTGFIGPARYGPALPVQEFETDSGEEQAEIQRIAQRPGLSDTSMHKSMPRRK